MAALLHRLLVWITGMPDEWETPQREAQEVAHG